MRNLAIIGLFTLIIFGFAYIYMMVDESNHQIEYYYEIPFEEGETLSLELLENNHQTCLSMDGQNGVSYISDNDEVIDIPKYDVVYFKEYENMYVVVYSSNPKSIIEYDRLNMPNYDIGYQNQDNLFLYVIDKENGEMILIQDYDLIGQTVDLTSFSLESGIVLSYTVFQPFQDKIRNVFVINLENLNDNLKYSGHYYQDISASAYHFYSEGDASWITYYAATSNYSIWADSYGEVHGYYMNSNDASGYNIGDINDEVFDHSYIAQGYVIEYNNEIYYVGETRNHDSPLGYTGYSIFKLNRYVPEEVTRLTYSDTLEDLSSASHWLDILYSLDE
ncbi:MAG: hypothetical protein AB7U79_08395 [Candidatus Izemoplasmatales bacterium]